MVHEDEESSSHELEDDIGVLADDYQEDFLRVLPRITMRDPTLKESKEPLFKGFFLVWVFDL